MDQPTPPMVSPAPAAPAPKSNRAAFVVLLIIVALAVAYGSYKYFSGARPVTTPTESANPSSTTDSLEGWGTFMHPSLGITVKYPADWLVEEDAKSFNIIPPAGASRIGFGMRFDSRLLAEIEAGNPAGTTKEMITVGGDPGFLYSTGYIAVPARDGAGTYIITIASGADGEVREPSQILSTLKFTDNQMAGWKVFASVDGGYRFHYPPSWSAVSSRFSSGSSYFGPGATDFSGTGGVEFIDYPGSLADYAKSFEDASLADASVTVGGLPALRLRRTSDDGTTTLYAVRTTGTVLTIYWTADDAASLALFDKLAASFGFSSTTVDPTAGWIPYNSSRGFSLKLPPSWSDYVIQSGLEHPGATSWENILFNADAVLPAQAVFIIIYTTEQWEAELKLDQPHPQVLGHTDSLVYTTPFRFEQGNLPGEADIQSILSTFRISVVYTD